MYYLRFFLLSILQNQANRLIFLSWGNSDSKSNSQEKLLVSWVLTASRASAGHSPEQLIIFSDNIKKYVEYNFFFRSIVYRDKE